MTITTLVDERTLHAGVGLSAGTIQWRRRPQSPAPVGLTIRDLRLMACCTTPTTSPPASLTLLGWGVPSAPPRSA